MTSTELPDAAVGRDPDWWLVLARVAIHEAAHHQLDLDQLRARLDRLLYYAEHSTSGNTLT